MAIIERKILYETQFKIFLAFGIIWGLLELLLAPAIKWILPEFFGILMPFAILIFLLTLKYYLPTPGSVMLMGILAAATRYLLSDTIFPGPVVAILITALIVEAVFLLGGFRKLSFYLTGILAELYNLFHPLVTRGIFYESFQFILFRRWLANILGYANYQMLPETWTLVVLLVLHIGFGILAGWLGWKIVLFFREKVPGENLKTESAA